MSNAFFEDPENRVILQICRTAPGYVPIVIGGKLHPIRETNVEMYVVPPDLSAEDFVLGLEVLGCKLARNEDSDVIVREPAVFVRDTWQVRARQIQAVMSDEWEGQRTALSDYLHSRGEGQRSASG